MKLTKIFVIAILFLIAGFLQQAESQNLACSTYVANILDSVAVAGSTDAGSDYFTNAGYKEVWLEVNNGTAWYTYKINYPDCRVITYFMMQMEGSDTTISVRGTLKGVDITLPLQAVTGSTVWTNSLDIGATTPILVRFRGFK